jgi:hypothetical protein
MRLENIHARAARGTKMAPAHIFFSAEVAEERRERSISELLAITTIVTQRLNATG